MCSALLASIVICWSRKLCPLSTTVLVQDNAEEQDDEHVVYVNSPPFAFL